MNSTIEIVTMISELLFGTMVVFTLYSMFYGLIVLASRLKKAPEPPKYEVVPLGEVYWVIKRTGVAKYYNHRNRDFNNLKFASMYDSEQLAYLNMINLK